jgi:hypothetical protein
MKLSSAAVIALAAALVGLTSAFVPPVPGSSSSSSSAISRTQRYVFSSGVDVDWVTRVLALLTYDDSSISLPLPFPPLQTHDDDDVRIGGQQRV